MKNLVSIGLIVIFLFNIIGYYGVYVVMTHQASTAMNEQIDRDIYSQHQAVIVKIPLALPYPVLQDNFERVRGEFEYKGEFYKLVKQKYLNDTVYIVCVKNYSETKALNVLTDFIKISIGHPVSGQNQNTKASPGCLKDYKPSNRIDKLVSPKGISIKKSFSCFQASLSTVYFPDFSPPPELTS